MSVCLKGGLVVDPRNQIERSANVYIDDGKIAAIGRTPRGMTPQSTIDVSGCLVLPGFVDLGAHLREPGFEHKATIATELKAAVAGGFTVVCCTPDTHPVIDNAAVVEHIKQRAGNERSARVFCLGASTANLDGNVLAEIFALKQSGCIAVTNVKQAISDTSVLRHALAYAASCETKVFLHPFEYWLSREGKMHEGKTSFELGIPGVPSAAELIAVQRDLLLVEETGVSAHFCRLSCAESVQMVTAAKRKGLPVTADVAITNLLLDENDFKDYDGNYHVEPPLRSRRDRSQLLRGLNRGAIDAVASNHEPHEADAKLAPFSLTEPGVSTFDTCFSSLYGLVDAGKLPLSTAVSAISEQPSDILGIDSGSLGIGSRADVCVFDPNLDWQVDTSSLVSHGKNSPLLGRSLRGKVVMTLVGGRTVYNALS